jgi:hypothetical protein
MLADGAVDEVLDLLLAHAGRVAAANMTDCCQCDRA